MCFGEPYIVPSVTKTRDGLSTEISFSSTHQGPFGAVNGGYLSGVMSEALGQRSVEVQLRKPVPIGTPTYLFVDREVAALRYCDQTLVDAQLAHDEVPETGAASIDEIVAADTPNFDMGEFADCFVCGLPTPQGLGLRPRPISDGRFAALWHPGRSALTREEELIPERFLRAVLDCPGGFAVMSAAGQFAVTGSIASRVDFLPRSDQSLIVIGEATATNGRKLEAVTTIYTEAEEVVATARSIWITP